MESILFFIIGVLVLQQLAVRGILRARRHARNTDSGRAIEEGGMDGLCAQSSAEQLRQLAEMEGLFLQCLTSHIVEVPAE